MLARCHQRRSFHRAYRKAARTCFLLSHALPSPARCGTACACNTPRGSKSAPVGQVESPGAPFFVNKRPAVGGGVVQDTPVTQRGLPLPFGQGLQRWQEQEVWVPSDTYAPGPHHRAGPRKSESEVGVRLETGAQPAIWGRTGGKNAENNAIFSPKIAFLAQV